MIQVANDPAGEVTVVAGSHELTVLDANDDYVRAEADLDEIAAERSGTIPTELTIEVHSGDGFGTHLFHEIELRSDGTVTACDFVCHHPNKFWEGHFGLAVLLAAVRDAAAKSDAFTVEHIDLEDDWKALTLRHTLPSGTQLGAGVEAAAAILRSLVSEAELALSGVAWKAEYHTDEALFCREILTPLLRRMGFLSVRYTHGTREYGKDFTFSELTPFGQLRHYGMQAKAGDISGGVNSQVDELLGQLNDAFAMPYYELGTKDPRYISTFVIAISGRFTENAREKIAHKMPQGAVGSVYFVDKEAILELIGRHWTSK